MTTSTNNLGLRNLSELYFKEFDNGQRAMAASPKSVIFCLDIIKGFGLQNVLDAGSGLSSLLFHDQLINVTTIDDNPEWAQRTSALIHKILNKDVLIPSINEIETKIFDFVFYDYGNIETRIFYFKKALNMTNRYMYIDDMHVDFYYGYIKSRSRPYEFKIVEDTRDEFGRYGALLSKAE